jgi:hypothetical protein
MTPMLIVWAIVAIAGGVIVVASTARLLLALGRREKELRAAVDVLFDLEWSGERDLTTGFCPKCGAHWHEDACLHRHDCALAAAIGAPREGPCTH